MKYYIIIFFLLLFGCKTIINVPTLAINEGITASNLSKEQLQAITNVISEFPNESELSIAILRDGQTTFLGVKRQNDSIKSIMNHQSVFEIGSITKVFTTHLLINTLNDGLIETIDASIQPHSPYAIKGHPQITFMHLANHTSGIPNNISASIFSLNRSNPYKNWQEEKLEKYLKEDIEIVSPPGEKYIYSNVGMAVLANTICKVKSATYETLLQEEIFMPLNMTKTTTKRKAVENSLVKGLNWKGKLAENWDLAAFKGTGAVLSSAEDLSFYIDWSFRALKAELVLMSKPTMNNNRELDVALGWHLKKGITNSPFLWHNGGTGGYKSSIAINLSNNTGVVVLTNFGAVNNPKSRLVDQLCYKLMKTVD